jgi:hypothetical protein
MKRFCLLAIIIVTMVLIVPFIVIMSITRWGWAWTGMVGYTTPPILDNQVYVPGVTLWDLLELLVVPAVLALTVLWFTNNSQRIREREIGEQRAWQERTMEEYKRQDSALQAYYDKMTELLLEKNLHEAEEGAQTILIAKARTQAILRSLDSPNKGLLIQFLYEAHLIDKTRTIIHLDKADLIGVHLFGADLKGADLSGADLRAAELSGADLRAAELSMADLSMAILTDALGLTCEQLAQVKTLQGATMMDGRIYDPADHAEIAELRKEAEPFDRETR